MIINKRALLFAGALLLQLCGCEHLPAYYQSLQKRTQSGTADPSVEQVYYVTDRLDSATNKSGNFTNKAGSMSYGFCNVNVPTVHNIGHDIVTNQLSQLITGDKIGSFQLASIKNNVQTSSDFFAQNADAFKNHDLLLFVHGYNTTFAGAVTEIGELANDLGGDMVPMAYCWASQGTYQGYPEDEDNVDGAARDLSAFLRALVQNVPPNKIHLIFHSMGARVGSAALSQIALDKNSVIGGDDSKKFADVVFASADIQEDEFKRRLTDDGVQSLSKRTTIYASYNDRALQASYYFHGNNVNRAGQAGKDILVIGGNTESIDASLNDLSVSGHSYYADNRAVIHDLYMLLVLNQPAGKRDLYQASKDGKKYWLIRP
jgi:esterase/lipase superfamily enzyme